MAAYFSGNATEMVWLGNMLAMVVVVSLILAACFDIATRTIPDRVVAIVAVVGLTVRLLTGLSAFAISAAASVVLFGVLLVLHARGLLGGGDVKLIAATALGFSLPTIGHFIFATAMAGGVLGMLHLVVRRVLRGRPPQAPAPRGASLLRRVFRTERWRIARHGSLPYGVAIACGGVWVIMTRSGS